MDSVYYMSNQKAIEQKLDGLLERAEELLDRSLLFIAKHEEKFVTHQCALEDMYEYREQGEDEEEKSETTI